MSVTVPSVDLPIWAVICIGTVLYLVIAIVVAHLSNLMDYLLGYPGARTEEQKMGVTATGLCWPVTVPCMVIYLVCVIVHRAIHGRRK